MYRLLYLSFTVFDAEAEMCSTIVNSARKHNVINGITGVLLTSGRTFLQVLEGEKDAVLRTLARIQADPRHDGITILHAGFAEKRLAPDWSMGFFMLRQDGDDFCNEGLQRNLRDFRELLWCQDHSDPVVSILMMYLDQHNASGKIKRSAVDW